MSLGKSLIPEFNLPSDIYVRQDIVPEIPGIVAQYGTRVLMISTKNDTELHHKIIGQISLNLKKAGIGCIVFDNIPPNPNTEDVDEVVIFAKKTNCNIIVALGGNEAVNVARAVSILISNYLFCDSLFGNPALPNANLPLIIIPTRPLYGFEIVPIFHLHDLIQKKHDIFSNKNLFPMAAIIDPNLSKFTPHDFFLRSVFASLAISIESLISQSNNDLSNTFALKSVDFIFKNLADYHNNPDNLNVRQQLETASVMSGIAFSVSIYSTSLAIALALTSIYKIDIELIINIIISHVMEYNLSSSTGKYVQIAKVMGENCRDLTVIEAAIKAVEGMRKTQNEYGLVQKLSEFEINKNDFKPIAKIASTYNINDNSPKALNAGEIEAILASAY